MLRSRALRAFCRNISLGELSGQKQNKLIRGYASSNQGKSPLSLKIQSAQRVQPTFLSPFLDLHWPMQSLWPSFRLLDTHHLMRRSFEEMTGTLDLFRALQHQFLRDVEHTFSQADSNSVPFRLENKGDGFELTLDTKDFSAEELSVRMIGNKLHVTGKSVAKEECPSEAPARELNIEFTLPEAVNPEAVTCSLADGKLCIVVPGKQLPALEERNVPINSKKAEEPVGTSNEAKGH